MKYSLGECLADYGFHFLEKVHEPIFLVDRGGFLVKINEAGRKFLKVAQLTQRDLQTFLARKLNSARKYQRISIGNGCQAIARNLSDSGLIMIEIVR